MSRDHIRRSVTVIILSSCATLKLNASRHQLIIPIFLVHAEHDLFNKRVVGLSSTALCFEDNRSLNPLTQAK